MQKDRYTDFDLELREMFRDAEENVPSGVWESIGSELDRRDRRRVVALRWRRAAIGVAAAAAVLSGIFVLTGRQGVNGHSQPVQIVAQAPDTQIFPADETDGTPTIEEQIAASPITALADIPQSPARRVTPAAVPSEVVPVTEVSDMASEPASESIAETPQQAPAQAAAGHDADGHVADGPAAWDDPFAALMQEDGAQASGLALTLSGNAMNNVISGAGARPFRAPTAATKQTTGVVDKSSSTYGIPLTIGIGAQYSINDRWSIGTGVNWTLLSRSFTGIYTEVDPHGFSVMKSINSEINNDLHYIGIPVNVYYNVLTNRNLKFYAWGGAQAEKGIVNKFRIQSGDGDIFYNEKVRGLQWSTALGLGLEFALNDGLGLYLDPSARYYFDCDQPNSVRTQKPYMFNFEVGLRFNL